MIKKILILLPAVFLIAGCGAGRKTAQPASSQAISEQVQQSLGQLRQSDDYVLQAGDLVEVRVFMEDSMSRTLRVSGNGTVTIPLAGTREIAGKTVPQAEAVLSESLKTYLKNPQVSIFIKEYGNKTVYVLGQVSKPSAIEIPPEKRLTVLEAITSAGGFTDIAAPSRTRVLRMESGKQKAIDIDVTQITKHGNKALDIKLMPGDIVFVPQSIF